MPKVKLVGLNTYHTLTRGFKKTDGAVNVTDDEWAKLQGETNPTTGEPLFKLVGSHEEETQEMIDAGILPHPHGPDYSNSSRPGSQDIDTADIRRQRNVAGITAEEQAELDAQEHENDPRFPRPNVPQFSDRGDPNSAEGFEKRLEEAPGKVEGDPNLGVPSAPVQALPATGKAETSINSPHPVRPSRVILAKPKAGQQAEAAAEVGGDKDGTSKTNGDVPAAGDKPDATI